LSTTNDRTLNAGFAAKVAAIISATVCGVKFTIQRRVPSTHVPGTRDISALQY